MSSRAGIVVSLWVVGLVLGGCIDTDSNTDLVASGPPEIAQVLMYEDSVDASGVAESAREVFAFGTQPTADPSIEHAVTTAAATKQIMHVIVDQLMRGNRLEQIECRDAVALDASGNPSPWSDVPDDATPDDIARCAVSEVALPESCVGANVTCICQISGGCNGVAEGAPVGVLDQNSDGAADETQLKPGAVGISCNGGAINVPLDPTDSYYNPSGNQLVPARGGFDAMGPAIVLVPGVSGASSQGVLPTSATCGLTFDPSVVDKADLQMCAIPGGRPASCTGRLADCPQFQQGCVPGDVSAFSFSTVAMTLSSPLADGMQNVSLTAPEFVNSSVPLAPAGVQNVTITPAPPSGFTLSLVGQGSQIQIVFGGTGLAPSTMYTLTVPTTVTDAFGQPPAAPLVIHFTSAAM